MFTNSDFNYKIMLLLVRTCTLLVNHVERDEEREAGKMRLAKIFRLCHYCCWLVQKSSSKKNLLEKCEILQEEEVAVVGA